jgi:hypothetical protein
MTIPYQSFLEEPQETGHLFITLMPHGSSPCIRNRRHQLGRLCMSTRVFHATSEPKVVCVTLRGLCEFYVLPGAGYKAPGKGLD